MTPRALGLAIAIAFTIACMSVAAPQPQNASTVNDVADFALENPEDQIVTYTPLVITMEETIGSVTHKTTFLLSPNPDPQSLEPAKGWFAVDKVDVNGTTENVPYFYLDKGYVYVWHRVPESAEMRDDPGEQGMQPVTRPRVRTRRVIAQGKGTKFIVQARENEDRVLAVEIGQELKVECARVGCNSSTLLDNNDATIVKADDSVPQPVEIANDPDLVQFLNIVNAAIDTHNVDELDD